MRTASYSYCASRCAAVLVSLALLLSYSSANAASCKTNITSCGCTITKSKKFTVVSALSSKSASADCIDITAPNAFLNLNAKNITGPGAGATGIGIHVMSSATGVFIAALGSTISGFGTGVQDDGNGMSIDEVNVDDNASFGFFINGASGSSFDDAAGERNGIAVVMIKNGSNNLIHDSSLDSNTSYGVEINGGSGNTVQDCDVSKNVIYGIWIRGSDANHIHDTNAKSNGNTGIYIGCADTGGPGGTCSTPATGKLNVIEENAVFSNGVNGMAIDLGDSQSQIGRNDLGTSANGGNGTADAVDENSGCGSNLWFVNSFKTAPTQGCIH